MSMDFDLSILLIVLPFVFVGGFIDSIAGGGGLINIVGFMLAGLDMPLVIGTNKVQAFFGTAVATSNFVRKKHYQKEIIVPTIIFALIASFIGASISSSLKSNYLEMIVTIILPLVAIIMLFGLKPSNKEKQYSNQKMIILSSLIAFLIGFYDGLIGPGTGTFLLIGFSMTGISLLKANGNAKIVNLTSNIVASIVFLLKGKVLIILAIPCIITSMLANYLGSSLAIKNGDKIVKPVILIVLLLLIIRTICNLF